MLMNKAERTDGEHTSFMVPEVHSKQRAVLCCEAKALSLPSAYIFTFGEDSLVQLHS